MSDPDETREPVVGEPEVASELDEQIRTVRERAEKMQAARQWSAYVMALLQLVDLVPEADEKLSLLHEVASLYTEHFANAVEAMKIYESVRRLDPSDPVAVDFLRRMYETRHEWEKMLQLEREVLDNVEKSDPGRHLV